MMQRLGAQRRAAHLPPHRIEPAGEPGLDHDDAGQQHQRPPSRRAVGMTDLLHGMPGDPDGRPMIPFDYHRATSVEDAVSTLAVRRAAGVDAVTDAFPTADVSSALPNAINYCESRRAFFVVDTPSDVNNVVELKGPPEKAE